MVKDHSDRERGNLMPPLHGLLCVHECMHVHMYACMYACTYIYAVAHPLPKMFYLTTHSTHFIYGYMASDMVKHHSDSKR